MRLFIIGNGFDIDHGINSKFSDFKDFLENNYLPTFNREYPVYPDVGIDSDGDITVNPNNSSQLLYCLINDVPAESDWCNFEECLGLLEYQEILDLVDRDEENLFHYYYNLEDIVSGLMVSLPFITLEIGFFLCSRV